MRFNILSESGAEILEWKPYQYIDSSVSGVYDTVYTAALWGYGKNMVGIESTLTTRSLDFTGYGNIKLDIRYAAATSGSTPYDSLFIEYSLDGGNSYQRIGSYHVQGELATASSPFTGFIPSTPADWCNLNCLHYDLRLLNRKGNVKLRVRHSSNINDQNIFIDYIRITGDCVSQITDEPISGFDLLNSVLCQEGEVQFLDTSEHYPENWHWYFPGAMPAESQAVNPKVRYAGPGEYDVALVVSNINGKDSTYFPALVRVNNRLEVQLNLLDTIVCPGSQVHLEVVGADSVFWSPSDYLDRISGSKVISTTASSVIYTYKASDLSGCQDSGQVSIQTMNAPAQPKIFKSGNTFTLYPVEDSLSYQWYLNWQPIAGATDSIWTPVKSGRYTAEVRHERTGCSDTTRFPVDYIHTGLNDQSLLEIQVYPNPGTGIFRLDLPFSDDWSLEVFDALGKPVWKGHADSMQTSLDLERLSNGVYFLQVRGSGSGRVHVLRLHLHH